MAEAPDPTPDPVPRTPCITEIRYDNGSVSEPFAFGNDNGQLSPGPGIRRVNFRAVIDTNPPFGSVKEAVDRFGGSGPWIPFCKQGMEEFDMKRMEEQTAELEKDLIVKELETLDVLEELGSTKRMVEELKRQLQTEALKCFASPNLNPLEQTSTPMIKEIQPNFGDVIYDHEYMLGNSSPCPLSSPDMILMELKQAKMNLGKTINDLGVIQTSVESLTRKMKRERSLLAKRRERTPKRIQAESRAAENVEFKDVSENSVMRELPQHDSKGRQFKNMHGLKLPNYLVAVSENDHTKTSLKTAELRLLAARKMEEAARAAEAVALAEVEALTSCENSAGFSLQDPETMVFNFKEQSFLNHEKHSKKNEDIMDQFDETDSSKFSIAKKLKEAKKELNLGKRALEEALNRVELANRKQLVAEETLRRWFPEHKGHPLYYPAAINSFHHPSVVQCSPLNGRRDMVRNDLKPVLRPTVSMRDVLSRKQVLAEEDRGGGGEEQKVALSQMLSALREDLTFPSKLAEKDGNVEKGSSRERKRFGFIHISLPLTKQSKKKAQS